MNGNKILQKCIEELKSESPEIKYVLGMLEALLEMQPEDKKICPTHPPHDSLASGRATPPSPTIKSTEVKIPTGGPNMDEGAILEANMMANLNKVDKSAIQTETP